MTEENPPALHTFFSIFCTTNFFLVVTVLRWDSSFTLRMTEWLKHNYYNSLMETCCIKSLWTGVHCSNFVQRSYFFNLLLAIRSYRGCLHISVYSRCFPEDKISRAVLQSERIWFCDGPTLHSHGRHTNPILQAWRTGRFIPDLLLYR